MRSKIWTGFRSILCPVDFSEPSRLALRCAAALAAREHAAVTVLYANDPLLAAAAAAALHDRQVAKRTATELQRFIDATIDGGSNLRMKTCVSVGSPADEILKAAGARESQLIVMGTHGLTGVDRLLMGSTALSVLQRTQVPVLAVPRSDAGDSLKHPPWPGGRILAAIELDQHSRDEVDTAARIAERLGSSLLLVHVIDEIGAPAWLAETLTAHDRIRRAEAEQQIDALAAIARRRIPTETHVVCGRPADEIAAVAAVERAALLITALRDRRGWFGARRGSVSYHVLSHAVAPVLAWPSRWRPR
jgi:nucleotide-binding universal stress UspA family protein